MGWSEKDTGDDAFSFVAVAQLAPALVVKLLEQHKLPTLFASAPVELFDKKK